MNFQKVVVPDTFTIATACDCGDRQPLGGSLPSACTCVNLWCHWWKDIDLISLQCSTVAWHPELALKDGRAR